MRKVLAFACIVGGTMPALAQQSVPTYSDNVVVTASAVEEEREELPASVTVIAAEEIAARKATSIVELIATTPGLTALASGPPGGQTSVFVRGAESDQTLLLWNGVPLNDPFFGSVNWQFLPADGIERVEVVRGPFSSLYGGNAVGGVVQVLTARRDGGSLRLERGEDGYARAGLAAGYDLGRVRVDLSGHLRRGDGEFANGAFDSEELMARAEWRLAPAVTLGLVARADDAETGIPFDAGRPSPRRRIAWQEREVALPLAASFGSWSLDARLSQVTFDNAFRDPDDPFGFVRSDTESRGRRARAVATHRASERLWIAVGAEAELLEVSDRSSFGINLDDDDQSTWALFSEVGWSRGRLSLTAGLRRDDNDRYGSEASFRGGLAWRLGPATRLRASYGEAFRPPTLGELFFPVSGNPDLAPERSTSYELGFEHRWRELRFELTGFVTEQEDLIEFDLATFSNVNLGRARSRGVEAGVGYDGELLALRLNGTYLVAEDLDTGLDLARRPRRSANLVLTLTPGEWTLTAVGRYVGARPDFDPASFAAATNPSYGRFDLVVSRPLGPRWEPYLRLDNAADAAYSEVLGFPAPGRTALVGLGVAF